MIRPPPVRLLRQLTAGLITGAMLAAAFSAYAALIFTDALADGRDLGLMLLIAAATVAGVLHLWLSRAHRPLGLPDGNVIAVTAGLGAALTPADTALGTLLAALTLAALATGAVLIGLARVGAGRLIRFLPVQIRIAFDGTAAWLFVTGGLGVALGEIDIAAITDPGWSPRVAATMLGAILLVVLGSGRRGAMLLPLGVLALMLLHHAGFHRLGGAPPGWLLATPELGQVVPRISQIMAAGIDRSALLGLMPMIGAVVLMGVVTIIVNLIGQEEMEGGDLDMRRELRIAGLSSLGGGLAGHASSLLPEATRMLTDQGGGSRLSIAVTVATLAAIPLVWPGLIGAMPVTVLGALLVAMGLRFGAEWLLGRQGALTAADWAVVAPVIAVAILAGPAAALLTGLVLGAAGFALAYGRSRPPVTRLDAARLFSTVERPAADMEDLQAATGRRILLHLRGHLFFGSAAAVVDAARDAMVAGAAAAILLDFSEVEGLDVSAATAIAQLPALAARRGVRLALAGVSPGVARRLIGREERSRRFPHVFATADAALEWSEDLLLDARGRTALARAAADPMALDAIRLCALPVTDVRAGTEIIGQGAASRELIFVLAGRIGVYRRERPHGRPMRLRAFTAGTMVGEIGFFLGQPRTATVTAETSCRIATLTRDRLDALHAEDPAGWLHLMKGLQVRLCHRLEDKDRLIASLMATERPAADEAQP